MTVTRQDACGGIEDAMMPGCEPCGRTKSGFLVKTWMAPARRRGRAHVRNGLRLVEKADALFASLPFTFECWLMWPDGTIPLRRSGPIAELEGKGWHWSFGFDHAGTPALVWTAGKVIRVAVGETFVDVLKSGVWYHMALVVTGDRCGMAVTGAGKLLAEWSGGMWYFTPPRKPAASEEVVLAIGRGIHTGGDGEFRISSAAWHATGLEKCDFPALGKGLALPKGVRIDAHCTCGSLARTVVTASNTIAFSADPRCNGWYAFRVRGAKGRSLDFSHYPANPMGLSVFVSEDGGGTWKHPNGGVRRDSGRTPELHFRHTHATNDTLFANSPPVTAEMADRWIDDAAQRFGGRIHEVGFSRKGHPLRVLEIGNPKAKWVYLQAGQHGMMERLGFFVITSMFEAAAADPGFLSRTRWLIMPVVNVDSLTCDPEDGDMNRFWGKRGGPPTVKHLEHFLSKETSRTKGLVLIDWHAGTVWHGHYLLGDTKLGFSDPEGGGLAFSLRDRESVYPELEQCLRAAGIYYGRLNGYARNKIAPSGGICGFAISSLGVKAGLYVELSSIVSGSSEGTIPVTPDTLRADGVRWCKALKNYLGRGLAGK